MKNEKAFKEIMSLLNSDEISSYVISVSFKNEPEENYNGYNGTDISVVYHIKGLDRVSSIMEMAKIRK